MCRAGSFQIAESSTTPTRSPGPASAAGASASAAADGDDELHRCLAPLFDSVLPQSPKLQAASASTITRSRERRRRCPSHKRRFSSSSTAGLAEIDPDIAGLLGKELERQRGQIELIASENFTWPSVLEAVGSVPTNKYAEGYPGKRYYGGCEVVDEIEQLAIDRAKELFGAEHANVQPHAGSQTNMAVYAAVLQPGDTILSLRLDHGGHLTHGHKVNFSGRLYTIAGYGVSRETMMVDYDEVLRQAKEVRPKLIVCGGSAYPRTVETDKFRADRRRGRRAPALRHGALRGARRRRAASESGRALRLRHVDDAQDARRPARGLHPLPRGARAGGRSRRLPRHAGRPARAHDRGEGDVLQDRDVRRVPRLPAAGPRERGRARRRRCRKAGSRS